MAEESYTIWNTPGPSMSCGEAAKLLGIAKSTVEKAVDRGELPGKRISGRILVWREPLMEMLSAQPTKIALDYDEMFKALRIRELRAVIATAQRELEELEQVDNSPNWLKAHRKRKSA